MMEVEGKEYHSLKCYYLPLPENQLGIEMPFVCISEPSNAPQLVNLLMHQHFRNDTDIMDGDKDFHLYHDDDDRITINASSTIEGESKIFPRFNDGRCESSEWTLDGQTNQLLQLHATSEGSLGRLTRRSCAAQKCITKKQERKQFQRDLVMARLENFFLVGGVTTEVQSSSTSVFEFGREPAHDQLPIDKIRENHESSERSRGFPPKLAQHQAIAESGPKVFLPLKSAITAAIPVSPDDRAIIDGEQKGVGHQFKMLQPCDRAKSLPLTFSSENMTKASHRDGCLTRKPSLKRETYVPLIRKSQSTSMLKRTVSFSNLEIREYSIALSDHPGCSFGPPVQLSWEYKTEHVVPVDSYEQTRSPRRDPQQLVLSHFDRRFLLLKQAGYTNTEIKEVMKEVARVKQERLVTDMYLPISFLDEVLESVVEGIKKLFARNKGGRT